MSDVRERHRIWGGPCGDHPLLSYTHCERCADPWPCDAIREADRADAAEADAERLAAALRDAIDIAHETDSLRSHSDDERKDGWFRAPLYRCTDAICEEATAALAAHDARVKP